MYQADIEVIRQCYPYPLDIVVILGSGLGEAVEKLLSNPVILSYADIPGFPVSRVAGHHGALWLGQMETRCHVACMVGRAHAYEGWSMAQVVYPLRVLRQLGAHTLIVTNAAGGVNPDIEPGSLMVITDHLNLMGTNPLVGQNSDALGPRFPDMSVAYTPDLVTLATTQARQLQISLTKGVYAGMLGPAYETPAEVRMLRMLGADAVGMSTVPEVMAAAHMGMRILGLSCITNPAAGVQPNHRLSHDDVLESAQKSKATFIQLLQAVLSTCSLSA
jgi:purine-nucleoside phosphorylase